MTHFTEHQILKYLVDVKKMWENHSITEISLKLGLRQSTISNWVQKAKKAGAYFPRKKKEAVNWEQIAKSL